jgi:uncharacterized membrane protein YhaH (DUF805 family)
MSAARKKKTTFNVLIKQYFAVFEKYAVFKGRARRREFWTFFFFNLVIGLALGALYRFPGLGRLFYVASGLFSLLILIPNIAVSVRRLHDTNRSGLWLLLGLIPLIGLIILIVWAVQEGTHGRNRYGQNPKGR